MSRRSPRGWTACLWALGGVLLALAVIGPLAGLALGDRDRWLLRIDVTDEAALARLSDAGARVVKVAPGYALVLATPEEEALPALQAWRPVRIAPWNPDAYTFVVDLGSPRAHAKPLESLVRVLHRDARSAVVEAAPAEGERLVVDYEAVRIFDRPLRLGRGLEANRIESAAGRSVVHDPAIQAMVDQVDVPTMQAKVQSLVAFGTRRSNTSGGAAAQAWLVGQFQAMGYSDVSTFSYNSWSDNVICVKPGAATPERIYVIGGHYDSVSDVSGNAPGADDNASGTVGVLEAARILAPYEFQSTLYLVAWSGEEEGLVGSSEWVAWAADEGLDIRAYVNLDMEGYLSGPRDLDILSNGSSQWLRDLAFEAGPLYVPSLPLVDGSLPFGASSDHAPFWEAGYPAIFFFEDSDQYSPYIHTTQDVVGLSLNSFDFMKENIQVAVAVVATLAEPFTIAITHDPLPDTENTLQPYAVTATIVGAAPLVPDSLRVRYRVNGGLFQAATLAPTGAPDEYRGYIPAQPAGSEVEYYLRARDQAGHVKTDPPGAPADLHAFMTGIEVVFADDAETERGWTYGATGDGATTGIWLRADPVGTQYQPEDDHTPDPGHICFVTGNGAPGGGAGDQDVDGGRTSLVSPIFSLEGAVWANVSYWRWYVDATSLDDDFYVYVSNDGGGSWQLLERVTQSAYPWTAAAFRDLGLSLSLTAQMRLKFVAEDVGSGSLVEAAIDDLLVTGIFVDPTEAGEPSASGVGRPLAVRPNPAVGTSTLSFSLPVPAAARLTVFDVTGRQVRALRAGRLSAGEHAVAWDGRDDAGRMVPAGVYLARLVAGDHAEEIRLTRLR